MLAREHYSSGHHFTESAASWPYVDLVTVVVTGEHDLGRPVVSRDHIFGQIFIFLQTQVATQPEITVKWYTPYKLVKKDEMIDRALPNF